MFRPDTDVPVEPVTIQPVRRLAVLLGQFLLVLVLFELRLHIYNPLPFRVRGNRIFLPINQRYTFRNDDPGRLDPVTHHTKNSLGFRGPDPPKRSRRRLTISTSGGSPT